VKRSKVHVVHVIEVKRSVALNTDLETEARMGEQILRRAEEAAAQAGATIEAELLQAREAGQALVEEARARRADAVAIGLSVSPVQGDFRMGRTAAYVLRHAEADVWLIRRGTKSRAGKAEEHPAP
jgi:nucleotide-binding universal stress UspA family protein